MRRRRTMKGGFWESITSAWEKTKQAATNAYGSVSGASVSGTPSTQTYTSTSVPSTTYTPPAYGGKKKKTMRRKMRGGNVADNISLNNLASDAAPFSGKTAQPHTWVGGKTRRRRHKRSHRKH